MKGRGLQISHSYFGPESSACLPMSKKTCCSLCLLWWRLRASFRFKDTQHWLHWYGFSREWDFLCALRTLGFVNDFSHTEHFNVWLPIHLFLWTLGLCLYTFPHKLHDHDFEFVSPWTFLMCILRFCTFGNDFSQWIHKNEFPTVWQSKCSSKPFSLLKLLLQCAQTNDLLLICVD